MPVEMPDNLKYDDKGLIPVVVQDRASGDVLMVAYANQAAVDRTRETGLACFWSRSRGQFWQKGETSGNVLHVREARTDCDRDTLLLVVEPAGPTCHTGARTCFGEESATAAGMLFDLERVIADRMARLPEDSYTARLIRGGLDPALKKVGEEATELVLAAKDGDARRIAEEAADLMYHLEVVLMQRGVSMRQTLDVLRERRKNK